MDDAESRLRVNERSWRPCEKTRSTAVDVAIKELAIEYKINLNLLTGYAEVVKGHAMKVRIYVTIGNPPFHGLLDVFDWFAKIFSELARPRSNLFGDRDISKGREIIVVDLQVS